MMSSHYFLISRADRPEEALRKIGLSNKEVEMKAVIASLPYGKIKKLEL
jgi:hypothetical protein